MDAKVEGLCNLFSLFIFVMIMLRISEPFPPGLKKKKNNGWRTSSGKTVSNKDLFCTLDEAVSALESRKLDVKFWWIERQVRVYIYT